MDRHPMEFRRFVTKETADAYEEAYNDNHPHKEALATILWETERDVETPPAPLYYILAVKLLRASEETRNQIRSLLET